MEKLRVWWVAQAPCKAFHVPVKTVEEGKKVLDILAVYDVFQLENHTEIKSLITKIIMEEISL